MAKKVDITEKLSFEGNPCLIVKGEELEVNSDAPTDVYKRQGWRCGKRQRNHGRRHLNRLQRN